MNCYIIQKAGRGLGVFTILFKIGSFNKHLDQAICAFQTVWQEDKDMCSGQGRRNLKHPEEEYQVVQEVQEDKVMCPGKGRRNLKHPEEEEE
eukprot:12407440-Ditylum_brightwellii.AAC.1